MKRPVSVVLLALNAVAWCGVLLGAAAVPFLPSAPAHPVVQAIARESARAPTAMQAADTVWPGLVLGGEVGDLVLEGLKLTFRIGGAPGGTADLGFLAKLPSVRRLEVRNAEALLLFEGTGQQVTLTGLNLVLSDFSPATGGSIGFRARFAAAAGGEPAFAAGGTIRGNLRVGSLSPRPSGGGAVEVLVESANYASGGRGVSLGALSLAADLAYDQRTETVTVSAFRAESADLGAIAGSATAVLQGEMPWRAELSAASVDFSRLLAAARELLPEAYRAWTVQGAGRLEARAEGTLGVGGPRFASRLDLSFAQGGFSSADGTKAAQGVNGTLALDVRRAGPGHTVAFDVRAEQRDGECLWGGYYNNFAGRRAALAMAGDYAPGGEGQLDAEGRLDLFQTGDYSFRARARGADWTLHLHGADISHARVVEVLLKDYLAGFSSDLAGVSVTGRSALEATLRNEGGSLTAAGTYRTRGASLAVPNNRLSVGDIAADVPFTLRYPSGGAPTRATAPAGSLRLRDIRSGGIAIGSLTIPLVVADSRLDVPEPILVPLFGGQVRLYGLQVDDVLFPARYRFGVRVDDVSLGLMTQALFGVEYPGSVKADLGTMRYENNRIVSEGRAVINVFDGEIEATDLFAENIASASRRLGGEIAFRDISLAALTRKVAIGRMSGIVQGSLKNFVMEYGEPASFVLHLESVPRRGVPQTISTDAIQSISILGTGADNPLNRGITRFFKEYPYSRIGLRCVLRNDRFSINGTIHEGGKEYLVRRGLLRGVDVINQNPDNVISFRDMQERLERIFRTSEVEPGGIRVE